MISRASISLSFLLIANLLHAEVEIPLLNKGGRPFCQVTIGGREYEALFDLGNAHTQIDTATVSKDFVHILPLQTVGIDGITGEKEIQNFIHVDTPTLGNAELDPTAFVEKRNKTNRYTLNIESSDLQTVDVKKGDDPPIILGHPSFQQKVLLIDLPHFSMTVFESGEAPETLANDWVEVPFTIKGGCIAIEASINGLLGSMILDTGANTNLLFDLGSDYRPDVEMKKLDMETISISGKEVSTGGYTYQINQPGIGGATGILGIPFFAKRPVMIDFVNQKVFVRLN